MSKVGVSSQPRIRDRTFLKIGNTMADAEEVQYDHDCLVMTINIVDCPMAEIPLTEVFDVPTMLLLDNYHDLIRDSVRQQLEDTTWLSEDLQPAPMDPGSGMYHARSRNSVISLQKSSLQRLIIQQLKDRSRPLDVVHVPVLIWKLICEDGDSCPLRRRNERLGRTTSKCQDPTEPYQQLSRPP
jgi:hypothetical protein